jgi:hypothetical protein
MDQNGLKTIENHSGKRGIPPFFPNCISMEQVWTAQITRLVRKMVNDNKGLSMDQNGAPTGRFRSFHSADISPPFMGWKGKKRIAGIAVLHGGLLG